jgi:hypothetical protein
MAKNGVRRGRAKSVTAAEVVAPVDAPVDAAESRLTKAKNAFVNGVKNHPFIAGGVAVTTLLSGYDAIANSANISSVAEFLYGTACVGAVVGAVEAAAYGAYRLGKAAYNNASMPSMESAKNAGKTALSYAAKPFTFGFGLMKAGYDKLPSFKSKAADKPAAATTTATVEAEEVVVAPRRSSRLKNK